MLKLEWKILMSSLFAVLITIIICTLPVHILIFRFVKYRYKKKLATYCYLSVVISRLTQLCPSAKKIHKLFYSILLTEILVRAFKKCISQRQCLIEYKPYCPEAKVSAKLYRGQIQSLWLGGKSRLWHRVAHGKCVGVDSGVYLRWVRTCKGTLPQVFICLRPRTTYPTPLHTRRVH